MPLKTYNFPGNGTTTGTGAVVLKTSPTIITPVINSAAHVGGTWVADATWTLPAFTLGGTVTLNGQSFSGAAVFNNAVSGVTTLNASGLITASSGITFGGSTLSTYTAPTSFTPTLKFGGNSTGITYGTQSGKYWRIGNQVFYSFRIILTSKGSSTGAASVDLPGGLTSASNSYGWSGSISTEAGPVATYSYNTIRINPGQTTMGFLSCKSGATFGLTDVEFSNTTYMDATGWFEV